MTDITWFVARRLDYIDALLAARGSIRRSDLIDAFGVSLSQATQDLRTFAAEYPGAIAYDLTAKSYVPAKTPYARRRRLSDADAAVLDLIAAP